MNVEIMDTTLRDGEQTSGVNFLDTEKLHIAKMLLGELKVNRIEVASARISKGEFEGVRKIIQWAQEKGFLEKIEVLGFIDGKASIDWIADAGGKVVNLLTKGSLSHVQGQLRKTPAQHIQDIKESIQYTRSIGMSANIYLEDWSNGMRNSRDYVFELMEGLKDTEISRFMLPDTLGILSPDEVYSFCKIMVDKYPKLHFDFHGHNDYDFAVANAIFAVKAGVKGIHTTVNGLGERTGNVPLASVIAALKDHLKMELPVIESKLNKVSRVVETYSGVKIASNTPVIGANVFTQACGVHADGDKKGNLYHNDLLPERFGRSRKYALGKTAGKASILKNLEELGIDLDEESVKKVVDRVVELSDKKSVVTKEDLPYIISDVIKSRRVVERIIIKNYYIAHAHGLRPAATLRIEINGKEYEETATGDGQYDAFVKAVRKIYKLQKKKLPFLSDYMVRIPPGGKTDALVETVITWNLDGKEFRTRGLDSDQTASAIKATAKMLNLVEDMLSESQNPGQ